MEGEVEFLTPPEREVSVFLQSKARSTFPIPDRVREKFKELQCLPGQRTLHLNAEQRFFVTGLPQEWQGRLTLTDGVMLESVFPEGRISQPSTALLPQAIPFVRLTAMPLPSMRGRVVSADRGIPVPGVHVGVYVFFSNDAITPWKWVQSNEDGEFVVPISPSTEDEYQRWLGNGGPGRPWKAEVDLRPRSVFGLNGAAKEIELDLSSFDNPWDLGDLALSRVVDRPFRVLDEHGNGIGGAMAFAYQNSGFTNSDGKGTVKLKEGTKRVAAGAVGYDYVSLWLDQAPPGELLFRLKPSASLRVHLDFPKGKERQHLRVKIGNTRPLFVGENDWEYFAFGMLRNALGISPAGGRRGSDGQESLNLAIQENQETLELWGLTPNQEMELSLLDASENILAKLPGFYLPPGQWTQKSLFWDSLPSKLQGVVHDEGAKPIAGAKVRLHGEGFRPVTVTTNEAGEFEVPGIGTETVNMSVRKEGFGLYVRAEVIVPSPGNNLRIILSQSRDLRLWVKDELGQIQSVASIVYGIKHAQVRAASQEDGSLLLTGIPQDAFQAQLRVGNHLREISIPAGVTTHTIEIPVMGACRINLARSQRSIKANFQLQLVRASEVSESVSKLSTAATVVQKHAVMQKDVAEAEFLIPAALPGEYSLLIWYRNPEDHSFSLTERSDGVKIIAGEDVELEVLLRGF